MEKNLSIVKDHEGKKIVIINDIRFKAKANASLIIKDLVQIATNKSYALDYNEKHKK